MHNSTLLGTIRMAYNELRSELQETGGAQEIYVAMDMADLANVVRAATVALERAQVLPIPHTDLKCINKATELRQAGDTHSAKEEYREALICYKRALAAAPFNSQEQYIAYAHLSGMLFNVKAYEGCLTNLKVSQQLGYPTFLAAKLEKRMKDVHELIVQEKMQYATLSSDQYLTDFMKFGVRRHPDVSCASEDVCVVNIEGRKKVVAAKNIRSGTMLAMERAYVSTQPEDSMFTSCYFCHKINFIHLPCDSCYALFCTNECMERCFEDYHRIECQIMGYVGTLYADTTVKLTTRACIKMSLKLGWKELSEVSREMGEKRLRNSTVRDAFDANVPASILCNDDQKTVYPGQVYNGSIICAAIMHCLAQVPGYLPQEENERKEAIDALSRVMMHLYTTFTSKIRVICSAYDVKENTYKCGVQRNIGWFSFTSKLAHSCEPNMFVVGLNDHVALVALQRIKKGDELTISYIHYSYDMMLIRQNQQLYCRQRLLRDLYRIDCQCRVCLSQWDCTTHMPIEHMTTSQEKVMNKFQGIKRTGKFSFRLKVAADALDAFTGCLNTTEHHKAYMTLRSALHMCQCLHNNNKGYEMLTHDLRRILIGVKDK